jgi:hypothetical protein
VSFPKDGMFFNPFNTRCRTALLTLSSPPKLFCVFSSFPFVAGKNLSLCTEYGNFYNKNFFQSLLLCCSGLDWAGLEEVRNITIWNIIWNVFFDLGFTSFHFVLCDVILVICLK